MQDKGKGKETNRLDPSVTGKKVSFAPDAKPVMTSAPLAQTAALQPEDPAAEQELALDTRVEGVIGQLEVYDSGTVRMRLANGIVLDVSFKASFILSDN